MATDLQPLQRVAPFRYRNDRRLGLFIITGSFLASIAFSVWARRRAQPEESVPPAPATTEGVVGWPKRVDPIAALAKARELTRRDILRGIAMDGVASTGTLDFSTATADVRYSFQSGPGQGPQPAREPGTVPRRAYCGRQAVSIQKLGIVAQRDNSRAACTADHSEGLPDPRCSLAQIWTAAKLKNAPTDRVARVEYYRSKAGPAWRFAIPNSPYHFSLYGDCRRELSETEAIGFVP